MKTVISLFLSVILLGGCASTEPDFPFETADSFMWGYTEAWNEHDATRVATEYWGMGATPEDLEKQFEQLRAQGYDKSTIHEIKTCKTGPDTAWAGMKYTRWKTDGEPLGPRDRAGEYQLAWVMERGWRIVGIGGRDASLPLECPPAD